MVNKKRHDPNLVIDDNTLGILLKNILVYPRLLIKTKNKWRKEIHYLNDAIPSLSGKERWCALGRMEGIVQCRKEIRAICPRHRWIPWMNVKDLTEVDDVLRKLLDTLREEE